MKAFVRNPENGVLVFMSNEKVAH